MAKKNTDTAPAFLLQKDPGAPIRILVSWSPHSTGNEAIEFAAWLGRTMPIQVRVVSTLFQPWGSTSFSKLGGKYKKWFKAEAAACDETVRHELTAAGIDQKYWDKKPSVLVDGPSRPNLLTEMAADFGADAILLGPNQAAPKGRFFAGSTADTLLHYSPVPLGLVPRGIKLSKHGVTRVNFALTDRSELGGDNDRADNEKNSLLAAAHLADSWNTPLRILAFSANGLFQTPLHDKIDISKLASEWREDSLSMLDRARDCVLDAFPQLEVTSAIGTGSGWAGAVDALKWKKGDLVCLASVPQGALARVFLGSTATALLPHMRVPVLVRPCYS